jgi:AraC-like DNA-binding protein
VRAEPTTRLAGLVAGYWEVRGRLRPFVERLLPSGQIELMVNLGPAHRVLSAQGPGVWDRAWFSGLQEHSLVIESLAGTHLVSARLHPLGARTLFGPNVSRFTNSVVPLDAVAGADAENLRDHLLQSSSVEERFQKLEQFLLRRLRGMTAVPAFLWHAAERIEQTHGKLRISELHVPLGISRKHLSVSFTRNVGISAKAYAQIQRFVWTLRRLQVTDAADWSKLAIEAGYSDQSHLVRDFRRAGAGSPTQYLRSRTPDGTALLIYDR